MNQLLIATILMPLIGAVLIACLANFGRDVVRWLTLGITVLTLVLAGRLVLNFDPSETAYAASSMAWGAGEGANGALAGLNVRFSVGLDGLGIWMFALSALLFITSVLVSWEAITDRPALFFGMLLLLEFGCLGVFAARDLILFYVFFEFTLIPLFFLIGIWGSEERRYAAIKFFIFTLAGSLLTFLGLLAIVLWVKQHSVSGAWEFSIAELTNQLRDHPLPLQWQIYIFIALFAGFAIKVPLFPLHTWLPLAHVQAPTAGSVILAGILLKIGVYGFLRFSVPMLPDAAVAGMPYLLWLSAAGIVYGALVALAQGDMKRLIAYSSVSHLGYCTLGLFALNPAGVQGSVLQMVNHGLSTGGLFALVGMLYERYHTRDIAPYGGLARRLPVLSFFFLVFTFSSIGLPGLNGFPGELFILTGIFQRAFAQATDPQFRVIALVSLSGVVLGAWYMLYLVQRVFFGPLKEPHSDDHEVHHVHDLSLREIAALVPLVVFMLWIGLRPGDFLKPTQHTLTELVAPTQGPLAEWQHQWERVAQQQPAEDAPLANTLADSPALADQRN
jgi:NADH-quinone oxidoreductase subunit M